MIPEDICWPPGLTYTLGICFGTPFKDIPPNTDTQTHTHTHTHTHTQQQQRTHSLTHTHTH